MKEEKKIISVSASSAYRLLHPKLAVLLTCIDKKGKANIITLAWTMPVSIEPPLVAVSIAPRRHSYRMIEETEEFVINIPTMEFVKETLFCGRRSGRKFDKFKETKFTSMPAKTVKTPIIKECIAHLECKLYKKIPAGDHTLFIGEIQAAYTNENVFRNEYKVRKAKLIFHLGGDKFTTLNAKTVTPPLEP
jgi:flavin reductase (DIM6/NTAB) family NADH-FMN oxidoreductase RutF